MVYPILWTALCYVTVITLFIKKVGVIRPNFGGSGPPDPPVVALLHFAVLWPGRSLLSGLEYRIKVGVCPDNWWQL